MRRNRRTFVKTSISLGSAMAALDLFADKAQGGITSSKSNAGIAPGDTVLFQGDSITDAGREYSQLAANTPESLGGGYVWLTAAQLLTDMPDANLKVFNRGINGNKVFQLADRWQIDCLAIKPNVLSILIGVNDVWHTFEGRYNGTLEKYESDYKTLLDKTQRHLPHVKLVICEPFLLKVDRVDDSMIPVLAGYRAIAKRLAEEADAVFVEFQRMFDLALKIAPAKYWCADGVHPTIQGAALMSHWWLKAVGLK